jgi:type II secretory pathway pseudopilin PulG
MAALRKARRRGRGEEGFTIIEVAVAAIILAISGLAVLGLVDAATRTNYRAEESQVVNDRLQQTMEQLKQLPYGQLALTAPPTHSNNSADPNARVAGTTFNVNGSGGADYEDLIYNGGADQEGGGSVSGGTVDPGPVTFQTGNVHGKLYRYVTWERDPACGNCSDPWVKHVVVAVGLDSTAAGGTRAYQEIQGDVSNPDAGKGRGAGTGQGNNDATPWTFWLTDTPAPCNNPTRQPIVSDHQTHNTLGTCSNGLQTGSTAGTPDLMFTQAAPIDNSFPSDQQPTYDYATDVEPGCTGINCYTQDRGLQEAVPANVVNSGGCLTDPNSASSLQTLGPTPQLYLHKWVSPAIPSGFSTITLDGTGELDLWTQTVNGVASPGRVCIWLFKRHLNALGQQVDTFPTNLDQSGNPPYFTYSQSSWPSTGWAEVHIPLHFSSLSIPAGDRLGVGVGVERQGTLPGSGLQFQYDHPSFDSRLEVDTHSLLPIF